MNIEIYIRLANNPHPNIREVYVNGNEVSEKYINGVPLSECGYFDYDTAFQYCTQIISAVKHIHSLGIIHRDIKPKNIIVEYDTNKCYLIDFDVAVMYSKVEKKVDPTGTIEYMSPEQIMGDNPEFSDDVYSLCKTLNEKFDNHYNLQSIFKFGISHNRDLRFKNVVELEYSLLSDEERFNNNHEDNESASKSTDYYYVNPYLKYFVITLCVIAIILLVFYLILINNDSRSTIGSSTTETSTTSPVTGETNTSESNSFQNLDFIVSEDNINQISSINVESLYNLDEDTLSLLGFEKDDNSYIYKADSDYQNQIYISIEINYDDEIVLFKHGAYTESIINYTNVKCETISGGEYNCDEEFMYYFPLERLYIDFYNSELYKYITFTDENGETI